MPVPARLVGEAKRLYRQYAECLDTMNLAQKPDREALACACVNLATAAKADRMLRRQGEVVQIPLRGGPPGKRRVIAHKQQKNRWWSVKVEAERQFARFAGNFGLTGPSSRAGMEAQVVTADDDRKFWELLSKPRPKGEDANREPTQ